jgi:hypothetical protein
MGALIKWSNAMKYLVRVKQVLGWELNIVASDPHQAKEIAMGIVYHLDEDDIVSEEFEVEVQETVTDVNAN